jgi:hypothetical protein
MTHFILIGALIVLAVLLVLAGLLLQRSRRLQHALQNNLQHARNELGQQETQSHDMKYEMTQMRIQLSSLKVRVNQLEQYQHILDVEQYVTARRLQADSFIEMTKINAEIMLSELKDRIMQVQAFLTAHQLSVENHIEQTAQEKLKSYWKQAQALQERDDIMQALERKINGYQPHYFVSVNQLQRQLIDRYSASDAAQHMLALREKIQAVNDAGQVAECHYLDDSRRQAAVALVSLVFNAKAELYLSLLNAENLGQLLQELRDDFLLINFHGNHFSNAHLHESYLNLRLEELKFMALMQAESA